MRRLLIPFMGQSRRTTSGPYDLATEDDLYYCYRLLLHREPDAAGWQYWKEQIGRGLVSLKSLTTSFLMSDEFLRAQLHTGYAELRMAAEQLEAVSLDGFQLYVRKGDPVGETIAATRSYEPHVTRALREVLKGGDVFVDIGANLGYFSLLAASLVGREGRVIAFEPNPSNCLLIRSSIARNGFESIELHANAVAEREESFVLEVDGSNGRILPSPSEAASPEQAASLSFPHSYLVRAVVLDELLAGEERINVIKIDIEGAEPRALRGMTRLVRRHRPVLITEFFPAMLASTSGTEAVDYLEMLRELEYALCAINAEEGRSAPQSNEEIFNALAQSGSDHLDLLALPVGRSG